MALFKQFTIDPISNESSGLGITAIELPLDTIFYEVFLDKQFSLVKNEWNTILSLMVIYFK